MNRRQNALLVQMRSKKIELNGFLFTQRVLDTTGLGVVNRMISRAYT
jgi:hypothetical protein